MTKLQFRAKIYSYYTGMATVTLLPKMFNYTLPEVGAMVDIGCGTVVRVLSISSVGVRYSVDGD
jgi:hypothetical protein